jgi:hypothetical protein
VAVAAAVALVAAAAGVDRLAASVLEALKLGEWYLRRHFFFSLLPALLLAGALETFINKQAVLRRLGAQAPRARAYLAAGLGGAVLAVCSCTVLPLFAGIYRMGAGLGPATTFLYAGPAINVFAVTMTASALGYGLGAARAVAAVALSIAVGVGMETFLRSGAAPAPARVPAPAGAPSSGRPWWKNAVLLLLSLVTLVVLNWMVTGKLTVGIQCCPTGEVTEYVQGEVVDQDAQTVTLRETDSGRTRVVPRSVIADVRVLKRPASLAWRRWRYAIAALPALVLAWMIRYWLSRDERRRWAASSWGLARTVVPFLAAGILLAGLLFGRPGREGLVPSGWITSLLGSEPAGWAVTFAGELGATRWLAWVWLVWTNLFAAVVGACMYFATLTEVPIVGALMGSGMGPGPALALLLAGPVISLPNLLVVSRILGARRTACFTALVVGTSALAGLVFGGSAP